MPKWLAVIIALCVIVATGLIAYSVLLKPTPMDEARVAVAVSEALGNIGAVENLEEDYYARHGEFGYMSDLREVIPGGEIPLDWALKVRVRTSLGDQAFAVFSDHSRDAGIECAALISKGEEERYLDYLRRDWSVEADGLVVCRRSSWPWSWLHWTGLTYLDVLEYI